MNGCMPMQPQPYDYGYAYPNPNPMHHKNLVDTIHNCQAVCEHMTSILKKRSDVQMRAMQLELLRDCADICGLTANYVARDSMYAKSAAELCACICESCARECSRFPDAESQHCAQVCMHCARECRAFAMMR